MFITWYNIKKITYGYSNFFVRVVEAQAVGKRVHGKKEGLIFAPQTQNLQTVEMFYN
jgi:hypothetical protein